MDHAINQMIQQPVNDNQLMLIPGCTLVLLKPPIGMPSDPTFPGEHKTLLLIAHET